MFFQDRKEAGERLATALASYQGEDVVVYALPRGGVVLGAIVAKVLHAPLDLVIPRKVGHPANPEYGICAVTESGYLVCNEAERATIDPRWFEEAVARERAEATRRRERYLNGKPRAPVADKVAIIIDDGIATGLTMRAAIHEVRARGPRKIVVAVPVIPPETFELLQRESDDVVAVAVPPIFMGAVGAYYEDFHAVSDDEVIRILHSDPILFHLPMYASLAKGLLDAPGMAPGEFSIERFPNAELYVQLTTPVAGEPCLVLGSLLPPDERLFTTLLLCHTLKEERAVAVTAIIPYLSYMRQDRDEPRRSRAAHWLAEVMPASGIDGLVTIDIHSRRAQDDFHIPCVSLSPTPLFAEVIRREGWQDATPVAPDEGAIARVDAVREAAGMASPITYMAKERRPEGVRGSLHGKVGTRAVIIDDILDTGSTLVTCCELLQAAGVQEICVMVTHGLFTGDRWMRLWEVGVQHIFYTDTLPKAPADARITQLSVLPLIIDHVERRR